MEASGKGQPPHAGKTATDTPNTQRECKGISKEQLNHSRTHTHSANSNCGYPNQNPHKPPHNLLQPNKRGQSTRAAYMGGGLFACV